MIEELPERRRETNGERKKREKGKSMMAFILYYPNRNAVLKDPIATNTHSLLKYL